MIINKNSKIVIEIDGKPNENWTGDNEHYFLVESNSDLAAKIRENSPFFDFVLDDNGNLVDVTPTERPPEPEPEPTLEEKLAEQAETISMLTECVLEMSEYVYQ